MHWVLQDNLRYDSGIRVLHECLPRWGIPHSRHKVVPFVGEIIPDINPVGNVIVIGAYSMRHVAKAKGWVPGCFDVGHLTHDDYMAHWGPYWLNASARVCRFGDAPSYLMDRFFARPVIDSKSFSGTIFTREEFLAWYEKVMAVNLSDPESTTIGPDTEIIIAPIKQIAQEYRCWIVDGRHVTSSLYKRNNEIVYNGKVDDWVIGFASTIAHIRWQPNRAYVLDVCVDVEGQMWVVEVNTMNSAGFYAADMHKLVDAIETMTF